MRPKPIAYIHRHSLAHIGNEYDVWINLIGLNSFPNLGQKLLPISFSNRENGTRPESEPAQASPVCEPRLNRPSSRGEIFRHHRKLIRRYKTNIGASPGCQWTPFSISHLPFSLPFIVLGKKWKPSVHLNCVKWSADQLGLFSFPTGWLVVCKHLPYLLRIVAAPLLRAVVCETRHSQVFILL